MAQDHVKNWAKTKDYRALKRDLLDDLEARGLVGQQYRDKVQEYLRLWCWLQMLNADIQERGVSVEYQNGRDQTGVTDNKSVTLATRVSSQMLAIWTALGFRDTAINSKAVSVDDDTL